MAFQVLNNIASLSLNGTISSIKEFKNAIPSVLEYGFSLKEISQLEQYVDGANIALTNNQKRYTKEVLSSIQGTDKQKAALKSLTAATKATSVAVNILHTALTGLVIAFAVKAITSFANREKEIADIAKKATDRLNDQKQAISDYATRIDELYKKINSGQLTLDEHVEANRELREIQKELIDNFKDEANGIDLVTSSLEEQKDVLEKINGLKNSEYLRNEWQNSIINEDTEWDKFIKVLGGFGEFVGGGFITDGWEGSFNKYADMYDTYGNQYSNRLNNIISEYETFSAVIEETTDATLNKIIESYDNIRRDSSGRLEIFGNVEEVQNTITHLQSDYKNFPGYTDEWANGLSAVWGRADDIVKKYGEIYHTQIQMTIASNEQYVAWQEQLQDIYKKYEEATISGDDKTADDYARQYKELVNQIRSQVQSSAYQDEIINIVPEIADVDYYNFEQKVQGILDSNEFSQFKSLSIPIELDIGTADLYRKLDNVYKENIDSLKQEGINSFEEFVEQIDKEVRTGRGSIGSILWGRGSKVNSAIDASAIVESGGSYVGRRRADGSHFITNEDFNQVAQYKEQLLGLNKLSDESINEAEKAAVIINDLTLKYGKSFTDLMSLIYSQEKKLDWYDWLNVEGFRSAIEILRNDADIEDWQIKEILTSLGLIESDTRRTVTGQVENFLKQSFGDVELSDKDLYWMNNLINGIMNSWSEEDLNQLPFIWEYVQVPEGTVPSINDLFNALIRYKKALEEVNQEENPFSTISDSVKDYSTDIKPWIDDLGSAYDAIFNGDNGFDIEVVDDDLLNNIRSQFESIQQAFAENGIADAFDTQALEDFLAVLSDDATTAEEAQAAFNAYATSLFYSADGLKNLNEETANSIKQMLQKSGVENYEDVVNAMLDYQEALEYIEEKEIDLTKVTADEIQMLITKGEVSEAVAGKITLLAMQEQLVNINQMNFESSINALYALAKQCGIAEEYVLALEKAMANIKAVDQQYAHQTGAAADAAREGAERAAWEARKRLEEQVSLNLEDLDLKIKVPKVESGGGGKDAGKEEADEYLEAFNAELENLDWLREQGFIDEKEYLDQLRILYERYFEGNDKYAKEFFENQRKYLQGLKDLYDNALSAITNLLDDEIEKYDDLEEKEKKVFEDEKKANDKKIKALEKVNKQLDKQIKALEKEQKAIQKQNIDPIEEQIKGREEAKKVLEEELSLMQKANDERQDAIDLQKLQYEMERAQHQKVNLVNTLCQAS